jgi:hypothetical protein
MEELSRTANSAAQRIDQHWKQVRDKQILCQQLADQLHQLNSERLKLLAQLSREQSAFDKALAVLTREKHFKQQTERSTNSVFHATNTLYHSHLERCESLRERAENAEHDSVEEAEEEVEKAEADLQRIQKDLREAQRAQREAESALLKAQTAHDSMAEEDWRTSGATTSQGRALQRTKMALSKMKDEIAGVEKKLTLAKKPPPPVYQPLPDSRKTDFDALVVLFFAKSNLTGSMPLLQKLCCDAQLAVCPWPLKYAGLWDVELPLSATNVNSRTWNEYLRFKNDSWFLLPHENAIEAGDARGYVNVFANFQEPSPTDPEVCSPPHSSSDPSCKSKMNQNVLYADNVRILECNEAMCASIVHVYYG